MTERGVAIVTGGASGIGLAVAKALLSEGWKLILADLAQGPLDAARAELEQISERVPQRRYGAPEEIAGAAVFLLDERKSSFVTGHILNVDGGFAAAGLLPAYR